uniref:Uncharacterized protein n=1 Tax=Arundo donax TaxID=35708 RepID=A0A0A9F4S9_ARUDO
MCRSFHRKRCSTHSDHLLVGE